VSGLGTAAAGGALADQVTAVPSQVTVVADRMAAGEGAVATAGGAVADRFAGACARPERCAAAAAAEWAEEAA
jgi:hypothetical protein